MDAVSLINFVISLVSGGVGGNITGATMPDKSLGMIGNTISGLIGGGAGAFILKALGILGAAGATGAAGANGATGVEGLDIVAILTNIVGSGVGGGVLTAIVALIKSAMQKT